MVTWRPAAGAAKYQVFATSADGDREAFVLPARRRRLVIRDIERRDRAVVEAQDSAPTHGPARPLDWC